MQPEDLPPNPPKPQPPPPKPDDAQTPVGVVIDSETLKRLAEVELLEIAAKAKGAATAAKKAPAASDEVQEIQEQKAIIQQRIQRGELDLLSLSSDIKARQKYADAIFKLIVCWLAVILAILILQGFLSKREIAVNILHCGLVFRTAIHFELSDGVLLALIGGTTATVLGLFAIVANYFFPKKSN